MTKERRKSIVIDAEGFIHVDGIKVARRVERDGRAYLQFHDKCKRRSSERGSEMSEIPADVFDRVILNGPCPSSDFAY